MLQLIELVLLLAFFYLLLLYALRWFERSNRPEFVVRRGEQTIYHTGLKPVYLFWREYLFLLCHLLLLILDYLSIPLRSLYKRDNSAKNTPQRPVVLVHGYMMRGGFSYSPPWKDISCFAEQLSNYVDKIVAESKSKVDIVAHSMGGLVSRCYINLLGGDQHVAHLVTLGTPHGGSMLWSFAIWRCGQQMRPGSKFLEKLAQHDYKLKVLKTTSIYSDYDELVIPRESPVLSETWVNNIEVSGVGHVGFVFDKEVYKLIEQAMEQ
jgi:predicted alpha/beta hydrolase family esterase